MIKYKCNELGFIENDGEETTLEPLMHFYNCFLYLIDCDRVKNMNYTIQANDTYYYDFILSLLNCEIYANEEMMEYINKLKPASQKTIDRYKNIIEYYKIYTYWSINYINN